MYYEFDQQTAKIILELIQNITKLKSGKLAVIRINLLFCLFFIVVPSNTCVSFCRPFVVNSTFSTVLVGVEVSSVSWLGQLTVGV